MVRSFSIAERAKQGLRDLKVVSRRLVGQRLPAVLREGPRHPLRRPPPAPAGSREVRVLKVVQETPDAAVVHLDMKSEFRAGQFLTFEVACEGGVQQRAYSIAAAEGEPPFVAVKRVAGGRVSPKLVDELRAGDTVRVRGPSGSFVCDGAPAKLVLIAGGSGITPIISIAETLLRGGGTHVTLLYGNRSPGDTIFLSRIETMKEEYGEAFEVAFVFEEGAGGGFLDGARVTDLLKTLNTPAHAPHFLCGPTPMMDSVREALRARGTADIAEEHFVPAAPPSADVLSMPQPITIVIDGKRHLVRSSETLLEAGLSAGLPMPFSCAVGGCAACKVKLLDGDAKMQEPNCLTDEETAEGYILACCSHAAGPMTVEVPQ